MLNYLCRLAASWELEGARTIWSKRRDCFLSIQQSSAGLLKQYCYIRGNQIIVNQVLVKY